MKKMLIILILLFTIPITSQSIQDKKYQEKLDLVVVNNGIDFKEIFVVYNIYLCPVCEGIEKSWKKSLFEIGLKTGNWYGARDNITIKGRYKFLVDKSSITISDSEQNFKIVGSITYKNSGLINFMNNKKHRNMRNYILRMLIASNP